MVGRNEPCPCGSGKKFKRCCKSHHMIEAESAYNVKIESIIQAFYNEYPKRKDMRAFFEHLTVWKNALSTDLKEELIQSVALDDYFFHQKNDIWAHYIKRAKKKLLRPATVNILKRWTTPQMFVGQVTAVETAYFQAKHSLTNEIIYIRRENDKSISLGMHVFCFILPDSSAQKDYYLAISTLIFFPTDYNTCFEQFTAKFEKSNLSALHFMKQEHLNLWENLVEFGYCGEEMTRFESGVLTGAISFLESHNRDYTSLVNILENYLIEQQPAARKEEAIVAGAIRFGQEKGLFESLSMTVKEIAERFGVSPSSLNKYYQDLVSYAGTK